MSLKFWTFRDANVHSPVQSHKSVHISGIYCHVGASSTRGCAFIYSIVLFFFMFAFMHYLCKKYYKSITVQLLFSCSVMSDFTTPWTAAHQASLSFTISWSLLKLMSIELVMPSSHLILCHPLLFLPSIFPSIRVFSSESALQIRWPKYWSFSFNISPSNEYSGLICSWIDWFDLSTLQYSIIGQVC